MAKNIIIGILAVLLVTVSVAFFISGSPDIYNFADCAKAGNPIMESYPRQCSADGKTFKEDIGGQIEKDNLIRVASPMPNATITSPLTIKGMARGTWFFEATFPFKLIGPDGKEVALVENFIQASDDWMTTEFVPFEKTITFPKQKAGKGKLILMKDNPSGEARFDDSIEIPVMF